MKSKVFAAFLSAILLLNMIPTALAADAQTDQASVSTITAQTQPAAQQSRQAASAVPTQQQAYERMIALKSKYPEGMTWTNSNSYAWKGGIFSVGYGCAGFAFLLSDAAFGDLPARMVRTIDYSSLKVGDILRVNNNSHSVIILKIEASGVTLAEGNYNSSIHWGRVLTKAQVLQSDYVLTRYPAAAASEPKPETSQPKPETEQPAPETSETHSHTYGAPRFNWSSDYKTCTAVFACTAGDDTQNVRCTVRSEQANGVNNYTASCTFQGKTYTDKKSTEVMPQSEPDNTQQVSKGITIRWNAVPNASVYWIYRKTAGEGWKVLSKTVRSTSYTDQTAEAGKKYAYAVRPVIVLKQGSTAVSK